MSACVIDASAVLAYLFDERGADVACDWMDRGAAISTANVQEVVAKLIDKGSSHEDAGDDVDLLALDIIDLTYEDSLTAGAMIATTKSVGLSAGDRCCIALAKRLAVPAVHAERRWQELASNLEVEMILVREPAT